MQLICICLSGKSRSLLDKELNTEIMSMTEIKALVEKRTEQKEEESILKRVKVGQAEGKARGNRRYVKFSRNFQCMRKLVAA